MSEDTRYCYGVGCTWHGPIQNTADSPHKNGAFNPPSCPCCGGLLFELPNKAAWDAGVERFVKEQPDFSLYAGFLEHLNDYGCNHLHNWNWKEDYRRYVRGLMEVIGKEGKK